MTGTELVMELTHLKVVSPPCLAAAEGNSGLCGLEHCRTERRGCHKAIVTDKLCNVQKMLIKALRKFNGKPLRMLCGQG
jgi:hypothetical protein